MNFQELMAMAAQKQEAKKNESKRYTTELPPAKKEAKRKGISPNVQAFLAKKEQEAKKKVVQQKQNREKYLEESRRCYRKVQNIHELIKEDHEKDEVEKEIQHIKPTSDKTAASANRAALSSKEDHSTSSSKTEIKDNKSTSKKKKQGNAPSFNELMKMAAEQKKTTSSNSKNGGARPMTAKEKDEFERQQAYKKTKEYRIWAEYGPAALERYKEQQRVKNGGKKDDSSEEESVKTTGANNNYNSNNNNKANSSNNTNNQNQGVKRTSNGSIVSSSKPGASSVVRTVKVEEKSGVDKKSRVVSETVSRPGPQYDSTNENVLVCRPAKEESSWERLYNRAHGRPMIAPRGGMVIESDEDEEQDEEMDDFIDDGPLDDPYGPGSISSHIRSIFGYDKRRFRDEDDDTSDMVSSFTQQMKEEARSARLGLKEDLEDIRREEEEMKRKMAVKKKMKR